MSLQAPPAKLLKHYLSSMRPAGFLDKEASQIETTVSECESRPCLDSHFALSGMSDQDAAKLS